MTLYNMKQCVRVGLSQLTDHATLAWFGVCPVDRGAGRSDSEALQCWASNCLYFAHPAEPLFMALIPSLQVRQHAR